MKQLLVITIMFLSVVSCEKPQIGEYVYFEQWRGGARLHIDRNCTNYSNSHPVEYIKYTEIPNKLSSYRFIPYCTKCVDDESAAIIEKLIQPTKKADELYNQLKDEYDIGTKEQFRASLKDANARKNLYDAIKNEFNIGSYSDFEKSLYETTDAYN